MSDTTTTKPRHEVLRERLAFFGFVADEPRGGDTAEYWKLGGITCALAIDTTKSEYARYCDRVKQVLAPFERAYHLGQRDEATAAAKRVWDIQEKLDTTGLDDATARKCEDVLEEAAFAAGGQYFSGFGTDPATNPWRTPWSAAEPGLCGCARCVDGRAADERANGVPFSMSLGSMGRMIVCETCGNKRCPHASFHGNACTFSNESGQPGSRHVKVDPGESVADQLTSMIEEAGFDVRDFVGVLNDALDQTMCSVCLVREQRDGDEFVPCSPACYLAAQRVEFARGAAAMKEAAREAVERQRSKFKARDWDDALTSAVSALEAATVDPE